MLYHILGAVSSALFLLTWFGLYKQLAAIDIKKQAHQESTKNLSINQFASSFFAFYANFIFGIAIDPFNHYLVWTRFGALLLLVVIIYRVFQERRGLLTTVVFVSTLLAFLGGIVSIGFRPFPNIAKLATEALMLIVTVILVQGTIHQYWLIHRSKSIGNLSFSLIQSILIKDITTLMFALTMPFSMAWPLLVLNGSSVFARGFLWLKMKKLQSHK